VLAVLLSIYDMVKLRADAARIRRELEQDYLKKVHDDENSG
jgi:hypothetical protein